MLPLSVFQDGIAKMITHLKALAMTPAALCECKFAGTNCLFLNCVFAGKTLTYLAAITVIGDSKLQDSKEKI